MSKNILNVNGTEVQSPLEAIQLLSDLQDLDETKALVFTTDPETGEILQTVEVKLNGRKEYGLNGLAPFEYFASAEAPLRAILSSSKDGYLSM